MPRRALAGARKRSGAFACCKQLFLVSTDKRSPAAERLSAFVPSPAGRRILAETGHWVP